VSYTGPGWTAPCCSPCTPLTTAPAQLQQSREAAKSRDLRTPVKTTGAAPPEAAPPPAGTAASPVGGTFEKIGKVLDASLSIFGLLGRGVRAGGAAAPHDVVDSPGAVPHGGALLGNISAKSPGRHLRALSGRGARVPPSHHRLTALPGRRAHAGLRASARERSEGGAAVCWEG